MEPLQKGGFKHSRVDAESSLLEKPAPHLPGWEEGNSILIDPSAKSFKASAVFTWLYIG